MPRLDGIAATRALVRLVPPPAVLVVTTFDLDEYVFEALRAGATGFLLKDAPEPQLLAGLRGAPEGVALLSPSVTRRLVETFAPQTAGTADRSRLDLLTPRETEVLTQLALGLSNSEIASALAIGETTVKTHVSRLLTKLGLSSRSQAVVLAYQTGLIRPRAGGPGPDRPRPANRA
jgi:DNA-binding NarL/FixJ family response regulator